MASKRFRRYLNRVAQKLYPDSTTNILSPESPPDWSKLGWKAGWIVEESHTGLQWWITEDIAWKPLTTHFGNTSRQKKEAFATWYGDVLDELSSELGKPLSLDSLRYREMDLSAFEGRPLIVEEDWWIVRIETDRSGYWDLIYSERFLRVFEEDVESSPEPEPPWSFLELWDQLDQRQRTDLLQLIGNQEGLINHLASLVISGNINHETLANHMAKRPREDLNTVVDRRRDQLGSSSKHQRDQTLDQWKEDAITYLTKSVGRWLEDEDLPSSRWKVYETEWANYRREVLSESFDDDRWYTLWDNLSEGDLKQVVPRLNPDTLKQSLNRLDRKKRRRIIDKFPGAVVERMQGSPTGNHGERSALEAREELFEEGRSVVKSMDYELDGRWSLESPEN